MAAQNIIDIGFDVEKISAEKKQVLDLFVDLFGKLKEYDGTKFNPLGGGGLADLKKSLSDGAKAMSEFQQTAAKYNQTVTEQFQKQQAGKKVTDELTLATKEFQKIVDQTAQTQAKANVAGSNAAENMAIEKEQLKQRNAELQKSVQYLISETGSVGEAKAAIAQLTLERNKQNATTEEGKAKILELNAAIDKNNQFINENTSKIEQQKNNVGNYTGAIVILKESLDGIGARLNQMAAAGDTSSEAFQRLTLEQKLLQGQVDRQKEGFASVTAELRSTKAALDTLTVAGLNNTDAFEKLNAVYTTSKQKVDELHNEQKILTSESPALTAMTAAARGLGGAYALGAGASALFADGNEKVEKELQKLVAVMTLLQGLEEAVKALRDRGAIATALQAVAIKGLNAVRQIETRLFGESVAAIEAETVAKQINSEASIGNAEAAEVNAAGTALYTTRIEGTVVATEAASVATIGLRTVLISTGIGALIIGIIYGITKLVGVIGDWINADERAEESQKALSASTAELLETTKQLNDAYTRYSKERIDNLNKENSLTQAAGKNQFVTLGNEKVIAETRLAIAKKYVDQKKIDQVTVDALYAKEVDALEIVQGFEEQLRQAQKALGEDDSKENKKRVENLQKVIEQQKADAKNITTQYEATRDALKEVGDAEQAVNENRAKTAKAAADELAKILADAAQRRYAIFKDINDRVLNLDTSTESQRQAAIKRNFLAEDELAGAQIQAIRKQIADQTITEKEGANQIANIENDLNLKRKKALDDHLKTTIEYRDRELAAQNTIGNNKNDSDASVQDAITKDLQKELDDRLNALRRNIDDKTAIIVRDYQTRLTLAREHGKTETEIAALASDRDKALVSLTADTQKQIYDITVSWGEKKLKAIEELNKGQAGTNGVEDRYNQETAALNKSFADQTISFTAFTRAKKKLDDQYILDKDAAQVRDDEISLQRLKDSEGKEIQVKIDGARAKLAAAAILGNTSEVAKAKSEADALLKVQAEYNSSVAAADKKLQDDKLKQNVDGNKKNLDAAAFEQNAIKQLEQESFNFAQTLVDASYQNRINKIEKQIEKVDEQARVEIEAVQRSTLSQRDQAAEIIILQANQRAKDIQLKNEEKQEKIKQAKFDRDAAVARTVWSTEQAVVGALATYAGTPYAFAIAAIIAAIGAVQVATILAKPIPTYAEGIGIPGKGEHPGGYAWAGEAGKPERVTMPGKPSFVVDEPTLIDMPAGTQVLPLNPDTIVSDLAGTAMSQGSVRIIQMTDSRNQGVEDAIRAGTMQTVRAIKRSQRKIQNNIHVHFDPDWEDYKRRKITGRA